MEQQAPGWTAVMKLMITHIYKNNIPSNMASNSRRKRKYILGIIK